MIVLGFALINIGLDIPSQDSAAKYDFLGYIIASAGDYFTLDFHAICAEETVGGLFCLEASTGFGLIAVVIGICPSSTAFADRETHINLPRFPRRLSAQCHVFVCISIPTKIYTSISTAIR